MAGKAKERGKGATRATGERGKALTGKAGGRG